MFSLQCFDAVGWTSRKGIRPVKKTGCWFVGGWSFAHFIAPVVTTTSIILSCIVKLANPGPPGKVALKRRETFM